MIPGPQASAPADTANKPRETHKRMAARAKQYDASTSTFTHTRWPARVAEYTTPSTSSDSFGPIANSLNLISEGSPDIALGEKTRDVRGSPPPSGLTRVFLR